MTAPATVQPQETTGRDELLQTLAALPQRHPSRPVVRQQAIEAWLPLAHHIAYRFVGKGEPLADLVQVASLGLIKAVDRFDPARGNGFASYAVPTISGELKRHFRDRTWMVQVPRHLREVRLAIRSHREELTQRNGCAPTPAALASALQLPERQVREAICAAGAHTTSSLDEPVRGAGDEPGGALAELIGHDDPQLALVEVRAMIATAVADLSPRDRLILQLRYYHDLSQAQIAARLGLSQMHVSRLLKRILATLRQRLAPPSAS